MPFPLPSRCVLLAVEAHSDLMSPLLLEHLLRGETFGRMREKKLCDSPFFGALSHLPAGAVGRLIEDAFDEGWLTRSDGFYPAVHLTPRGETFLQEEEVPLEQDISPAECYRLYHRWRQSLARQLRKPAYRILTNAVLNALATMKPVTLEELLMVPGIGKRRALRYRDGLIAVGKELRMNTLPPAALVTP